MRKHIAQFCDQNGLTCLGSDSVIVIDGRWNQLTIDSIVSTRRNAYKKHMRHKYDSFTHYVYRGVIREVKTSHA